MAQPIDRTLLNRDLAVAARLIEALLSEHLKTIPFPLSLAVQRVDLHQAILSVSAGLASSPDADLAMMLDALGREFGAIRGELGPLEGPQSALEAAARRIAGRLL
jgi:hypothetical protein